MLIIKWCQYCYKLRQYYLMLWHQVNLADSSELLKKLCNNLHNLWVTNIRQSQYPLFYSTILKVANETQLKQFWSISLTCFTKQIYLRNISKPCKIALLTLIIDPIVISFINTYTLIVLKNSITRTRINARSNRIVRSAFIWKKLITNRNFN